MAVTLQAHVQIGLLQRLRALQSEYAGKAEIELIQGQGVFVVARFNHASDADAFIKNVSNAACGSINWTRSQM
jgi:hypothetical protein